MRARPVTPERLVAELADRAVAWFAARQGAAEAGPASPGTAASGAAASGATTPGVAGGGAATSGAAGGGAAAPGAPARAGAGARTYLRMAFDGAPAAEPERLADALVDPLRLAGHPTLRVDLRDWLRPASVRLEQGRTNPDAYYEQWYDLGALGRELLGPLARGGNGRVLPAYWDPDTDRSARASYLDVPDGGVLLLSGPLLLGAGLDLDLTVHCVLSRAALARRTPPETQWTLAAFHRYEQEVNPAELADVAVRTDDPRHPAVVVPGE